MYTKLKKLNEGFTIVETLIVLAIAALILIIVLIAVPDLQRSARNSNTNTDAQNIATTIQTFESNNDGAVPNAISAPSTDGTITVCSLAAAPGSGQSTTGACADGVGANATGHIQATEDIYIESAAASNYTTPDSATTIDGNIYVVFDGECPTGLPSGNNVTETVTTNNRGAAIMYLTETSSSAASWNCTQE